MQNIFQLTAQNLSLSTTDIMDRLSRKDLLNNLVAAYKNDRTPLVFGDIDEVEFINIQPTSIDKIQ
jgi:hypothetical protein